MWRCTPTQKFEVLKQRIHNNVEELGKGLLPVVNETIEKGSELIQKGLVVSVVGTAGKVIKTAITVAKVAWKVLSSAFLKPFLCYCGINQKYSEIY